jgi:hypothetical protein
LSDLNLSAIARLVVAWSWVWSNFLPTVIDCWVFRALFEEDLGLYITFQFLDNDNMNTPGQTWWNRADQESIKFCSWICFLVFDTSSSQSTDLWLFINY